MDFFEQIAGKPLPKIEDAEVKLDLSGMEKADALAKLDAIVKYCKKSSTASLYVSFSPARPEEKETLFQPVARYFKIEMFNNYVRRVFPMITAEAAGVFVVFRL